MPPPVKRQKKNEDDLICPINLNLPVDPVVAEDGRVYEREAIEKYIKNNSGSTTIKSPYVGVQMDKRLLAVPQIKNQIETMIENGVITGEPAEEWKRRVKEKKDVEDLLKKAGGGDVDAMEDVALNYDHGQNGVKRDLKMAYEWYKKAQVAGSILGLAKVGELLAVGVGVKKDTLKAMMYLTRAAERGSDLGAYFLGKFLAGGLHGFPVDKVEARILLEKSLSGNCSHKNMNDGAKRDAQRTLNLLVNQEQATL